MPWDPLTGHTRWPVTLEPRNGYTAVLPSSALVGTPARDVYNHIVNWRMQGPQLYTGPMTDNSARNDATGVYYVITNNCEPVSGQDRRLHLQYWLWGSPAAAAYSLDWADPNDAANDATLLSGTGSGTLSSEPQSVQSTVEFAETAHADGIDYCTLTTDNLMLASLIGWPAPRASLASSQCVIKPQHVAPKEVISTKSKSLGGEIDIMYHDTDLVTEETIERMSRRCFFSWSCSSYSEINNTGSWENFFTELTFPAWCRNLTTDDDPRYCHPAVMISHSGTTHGETVKVRMRSTVSGNIWEYQAQAGDPASTVMLIAYDKNWNTASATGISDTDGIEIKVETTEDYVVVEGYAGNSGWVRLHSAALYEGPLP